MAGCESKAVADALKAKGLLPERNSRTKPKPRLVHTYNYATAAGECVFQVRRYDPKAFRQRRPDPANPGEWVWSLGDDLLRPLYHLPELLAADPADGARQWSVARIGEGSTHRENRTRRGSAAWLVQGR
jgi:hypothetical protein